MLRRFQIHATQMMPSNFILFLNLGGGEVVLILFVILLMFGGKGIPSIAKTLGKGIREFKNATNDIQRDIHQSTGGITQQVNEQIQEIKKELDVEKD
jgi:sec-independent protein translocase protein TatA